MYDVLLHSLSKRDNFNRFRPYIKEHTVPREVNVVLDAMKDYFNNDETVKEIKMNVFVPWFKLHKIASLSREKHAIYEKMFDTLLASTPTEEEIKNTIEFFIEKDYAVKISDHLIRITEGDDSKSIHDVKGMLKDYEEESDSAMMKDLFSEHDLEDILDNHTRKGLNWRLNELNRSLGPLRQGDFLIVTSRPDAGKTTFLCAEATFMASQLEDDQDVIWFNNEETVKKVKQRIYQAALGWTKGELMDNTMKTRAELEKVLGRLDRIKVVDHKLMNTAHVEKALEESNPGLIIFDQLWKISGFKDAFSEVDKITKLFAWARGLADNYAPVINVHQADASASGEQYIEMNQLYNSKTGIQGEADAILGIGRVFDPAEKNSRWIYASKNKLDGGPMSVEDERNGRYAVEIQPQIARFKGTY